MDSASQCSLLGEYNILWLFRKQIDILLVRYGLVPMQQREKERGRAMAMGRGSCVRDDVIKFAFCDPAMPPGGGSSVWLSEIPACLKLMQLARHGSYIICMLLGEAKTFRPAASCER